MLELLVVELLELRAGLHGGIEHCLQLEALQEFLSGMFLSQPAQQVALVVVLQHCLQESQRWQVAELQLIKGQQGKAKLVASAITIPGRNRWPMTSTL
jgi:hypothetical protein